MRRHEIRRSPVFGKAFVASIGAITGGGGICLTQDTHAPELGSFIVPNLGITIVPIVYGDHHSWKLGVFERRAP